MKIKKILGFIALAVLVILPIKASAASYGISWTESEVDSEGYFTVTVKGTQSGGGQLSNFSADMTMQNVEYVEGSITGNGTWTGQVTGSTVVFTSSSPVTDSEFVVGTLKFKKSDTAIENCNVTFVCNGTTKTVTPETPENPKTGNALPYAVIGAGIAIAGTVYYVTRKNTKLYKI